MPYDSGFWAHFGCDGLVQIIIFPRLSLPALDLQGLGEVPAVSPPRSNNSFPGKVGQTLFASAPPSRKALLCLGNLPHSSRCVHWAVAPWCLQLILTAAAFLSNERTTKCSGLSFIMKRHVYVGAITALNTMFIGRATATPSIAVAYCASINTATTAANSSTFQSEGLCYNFCNDDGYALGVLQDSECWCSNYVPDSGDQVDTSKW